MSIPAWVGTGLIVGSFASWVMDGSDPNDRPDQVPMEGLQVSITPSVSGRFIYNNQDGNLITIESLRAVTNADGVLGYYENPGDASSWRTGIRAVSPLDEGLDPNGWTYHIRIRSASNALLSEYSISFAPDEIVDLATVTPVPPNPGASVAEWLRVRDQVVADAIAAAQAEAMQVIHHETDASVARPPGAPAVYWVGSVEPENAIDGDLWIGGM